MMVTALCPDCEHPIDLTSHPKKGQLMVCPNCHTELEVISLNPVELDWAYYSQSEDEEWVESDWEEEEEDWAGDEEWADDEEL
ncbi:MAG: hypothetical protein AB1791_09220 [Chloroflexota bacterium]